MDEALSGGISAGAAGVCADCGSGSPHDWQNLSPARMVAPQAPQRLDWVVATDDDEAGGGAAGPAGAAGGTGLAGVAAGGGLQRTGGAVLYGAGP